MDWFRKRSGEKVARPGYTGPTKLPERYKAQAMMSMAVPKVVGEYGKSLVSTVRNIPGLMRESEKVLSQKPSPEYSLGMTELAAMTLGGGWPGGLPARATGVGQIRGYHGSPHKFTRFSSKKIGTGEGAQAFGYGLYFTSKKEIADLYVSKKSVNKIGNVTLTSKVPFRSFAALFDLKYGHTTRDSAIRVLEYDKKELIKHPWIRDDIKGKGAKELDTIIRELKKGRNIRKVVLSGKTYKVTLHKGKKSSEYDYLKWDKPVTERQAQKIRTQIVKENIYSPFGVPKGIKAKDLYEQIGLDLWASKRVSNPKREASAFLLRAGIDGIEYPSGTLSGIKGSKIKNYVVFDEKSITMEK